jgi:16S rRNA (cytidine1402-2'-O)-methyltransferase
LKECLYIVSTPIGNYDDITLRALDTLKTVDFIICEELKPARRLLSNLSLDKQLFPLNEHNEKEEAAELINEIKSGKTAALISDGGTPLFSDPGHYLLDLAISYNIKVEIIPGVNSLIPAITASNLKAERFYYYGWLSPKKDERRKELKSLRNIHEIIALMETPYRLKKIMSEAEKTFGKFRPAVLAYKLTMKDEIIYRGSLSETKEFCENKNLKGEFVLLIDNRQ